MIGIDRLVSVTMSGSPAERVEPLTLAQAKDHLRLPSDTREDDAIRVWIAAARGYLEEMSGRQTITALYDYTCFPISRTIEVPRPPLSIVLSVVAIDPESGSETEIAPSTYRVTSSGVASGSPTTAVFDPYCPPGQIALLSGAVRPTGSIRIRRICGYGSEPAQMPAIIQSALLMLVGHFYRNRAEVTAENLMALPMGADLILKGLKYDALVVQR